MHYSIKILTKDEVHEIHNAFCKKQKQMKCQELTDIFYNFQRQLLDQLLFSVMEDAVEKLYDL